MDRHVDGPMPVASDLHTNGHGPASALLSRLVELASRPLDEAEALPGAMFYDPDLYELEVERIFRKEWLYVARVEELPKAGDYVCVEVAGEPIMVVRGADGQIRALSRVCLHKYADVLGDEAMPCGNVERFLCPYHSWSYGLDGNLTGAPFMRDSKLFQRENDTYRLPEYRVAIWQGFVFVNFDPDATELAPRLTEVEEVLGGYNLADWRIVDRIDWGETPVNWKLVMDNGRECYHHQGTHKHSLEFTWPTRLVETETTDSREWYYQRIMASPEGAGGHEEEFDLTPLATSRPAPGLSAYQRSHLLLIGIYPTFFMVPGPDLTVVFRYFPTGPESHRMDIGLLAHESHLDDPDFPAAKDAVRELFRQVQEEDSRQILAIQGTVRSEVARRGRALSTLERPSWQFQRYLAHRLTGADV
ncbi:aromatic ring-hydroxylating oxygenase subunit alpha [Capillimicrobium parvum]|uniref:Carnitine monooxygenase oxygenase subunit n=1 Tax=Capillimicrobium parvum TaxID=2884022 RepID=A0A9E7BZ84_9ACTN|nr:aromatic ring-hydroxylating dioxygenase subunit alpha [Capillimicrobium parvum]UGS35070.1 Carnitine monooxygenase oxygenase subunit [Capillimicrobium parvum]